MLSPTQFEKYGLDEASLKKLFTAEEKSEKLKKFICLTRDRIKDGRDRSLKDYRHWAAVDLAYDAPFYQETPTLIRHVLNTCNTAKDVMKAVQQWGLRIEDLFCKCQNNEGADTWELNAPVFFETLVPIVRAYVSVRVAKIFNDRNLLPLFKYEPLKYTAANRVRCEIITDIVQAMTAQFNYAATMRQLIFQTLLYSVCLKFPLEPWYTEKGITADGSVITEKEGLRYITPHITRLIYDSQYPLSTFNTDSGCSFAGYWTINRWGDIDRNDNYWNKDKVSYGFDWLGKTQPWVNYFEQAYPCTLELPSTAPANSKMTDREEIANRYSTTDYDKAVFVTPIFQKIIPKEWGIGDYEYNVWLRTIIAADDTVIHAECFPYNPVVYSGYDADLGRGLNASLALELVPYQDHFANLVTQMLLTIKRNLANITFYDTNVVNDEQVDALRVHTNWQYQRINLIGYDSFKGRLANADPRAAFHEVKFQYADISQMMTAFTMMMSIVERLLGFSAQELGGQATHQQSKAEVVLIAGSTSTRVTYTGSFIDEAVDAWKKQLYDACIAYLDSDVVSQVSVDIPELDARLKELGFRPEPTAQESRKVVVKGKKENLKLEGFASTREGPERGNDRETAQSILMTLQAISNNPRLSTIIDPNSILEYLELAAKMMGADRDFKLRINPDAMKSQQLADAIQQIAQMIEQQLGEKFGKPVAQALQKQDQHNQMQDQKIGQQDQQLAQQDQQMQEMTKALLNLQKLIEAALQAPPAPAPGAMDMTGPPPGPPPGAMPPPEMLPPQPPPMPPNAIETLPPAPAPAEAAPGIA